MASLLSSSCLHFKEVLKLMTTDKKMKNSSRFTEKAYRLEPGRIGRLFIDLTNKRSIHEVSRGRFSSNKNIEAV